MAFLHIHDWGFGRCMIPWECLMMENGFKVYQHRGHFVRSTNWIAEDVRYISLMSNDDSLIDSDCIRALRTSKQV